MAVVMLPAPLVVPSLLAAVALGLVDVILPVVAPLSTAATAASAREALLTARTTVSVVDVTDPPIVREAVALFLQTVMIVMSSCARVSHSWSWLQFSTHICRYSPSPARGRLGHCRSCRLDSFYRWGLGQLAAKGVPNCQLTFGGILSESCLVFHFDFVSWKK